MSQTETKYAPCLLSTRQTDAPSTDFCGIAILKHVQVRSERAGLDDLFIPILIERRTEEYIVLDRKVLEPRRLGSVGKTVHKAVFVDLERVLGEYKLPFEFGHFSKECHLGEKVSGFTGKRSIPLTRRAVFPLAVGPRVLGVESYEERGEKAYRTSNNG
jgi:hypothetical protein